MEQIRDLEENITILYKNYGNVNYVAIQQLTYQKWLLENCLCKYNEFKKEKGE